MSDIKGVNIPSSVGVLTEQRQGDANRVHHLEFTYLTVCNLCENTQGLLYMGLLLGCHNAVVLQDVELYVSACRLGL